jgi:hypothetical protein
VAVLKNARYLQEGCGVCVVEVTLKVAVAEVAEGGEPPAFKFDDSSQGFE